MAILGPSRPTQHPSATDVNALDADAPVSSLSLSSTEYPLESLEVHQEAGDKSDSSAVVGATPVAMPFSRRKATLISLGITLIVVLATAVTLAQILRKNITDKALIEYTVPTQEVTVEGSNQPFSSAITETEGLSVLVGADLIARGNIRVGSGEYTTSIQSSDNLNQNQVLVLPTTSGTICLDSNNCNFASQANVTALQNQLGQLAGVENPASTLLNGIEGVAQIQGSANRIAVTTNGNVVTISTPQDLHPTASVSFGNLSLAQGGQLLANTIRQTSTGNNITIDGGNDNVVIIDSGRTFTLPVGGLGTQEICTDAGNCGAGGGSVSSVNAMTGALTIQGTANQISVLSAADVITLSLPQSIAVTSNVQFNNLTLGGNLVATGNLTAANLTISGTITGASLFQGLNQVCDTSNNCSYAPISGSANYIHNGITPQVANFNITGSGTIGGTLYASTINGGTSDINITTTGGGDIRLTADDFGGDIRIEGGNMILDPNGYLHLGTLAVNQILMGQTSVDRLIALRGTTQLSNSSSSTVTLTVQGASGQTANIQEWRSNGGSVLASIGGTGSFTVDTNTLFVDAPNNTVGIGTLTPAAALEVNGDIFLSSHGSRTIRVVNSTNPATAGGSLSLFAGNGNGGNGGSVNINGGTGASFTGGSVNINGGGGLVGGNVNINAGAGGFTNGSVVLQSTFSVNTDGRVTSNAANSSGFGHTFYSSNATASGTLISVNNTSSSSIVLRAAGLAGFGEGLNVFADGKVGINNATSSNRLAVNALSTADNSAQVAIATNGNNNKGVVVQGAVGQVADLFQAQDSTGTVLASIDASGNLFSQTGRFGSLNLGTPGIVTASHTYSSGANCTDDCIGIASIVNIDEHASAHDYLVGIGAGVGTIAGSYTLNNAVGLLVVGATAGSGSTITDNYGIQVLQQSAGVNNYGIYIEGADTYALWVDDGVTRLDGLLEIGTLGVADSNDLLCRNSLNEIASCSGVVLTASNGFSQGGNSFGGTATLGTNDAESLEFETDNTTRMVIDASGDVTLIGVLSVNGAGANSFTGSLEVDGLTTLNGGLVLEVGDSLTLNGESITDFTGSGLGVSSSALTIALQANKGLEVDGNGLSLIDCATDEILKYSVSNQWVCASDAGSGGGGDSILVNGAATSDVNLLNTSGSGTTTSVTWSLDSVANPDGVSIAIGNASSTEAGAVTTGAQTFAGAKTFNGLLTAGGGISLGSQTLQGTTALIDFSNFDVDAGGNTAIAGTLQVATLGTTNTSSVLCRNSSNQLAGCATTFLNATNGFSQGGNSFGTAATLGTTDAQALNFMTDGSTKMSIATNGSVTFNQSTALSVVTNPTSDGAGMYLTLKAGDGNGATTGGAGGYAILQGGDAAGSGNNDGGDVFVFGGDRTGTGLYGDVIIARNDSGSVVGNVGFGVANPQHFVHINPGNITTRVLSVQGSTTASEVFAITATTTNTSAEAIMLNPRLNPSAPTSAVYGLRSDPVLQGSSDVTTFIASSYRATIDAARTGTIGAINTIAVQTPDLTGGGSIPGVTRGINVNNQGFAGVTTATGIHVVNQTGAATNIGVRIEGASTYALWVDDGITRLDGNVGINNTTAANPISLNTLTTTDSSAQLAVATNGTTNKGVVVQGVVGQTADLFQAQSSTGSVLARISSNGSLTVVNATVNGTLTVNGNTTINGHVISGNSSGSTTISAGAAANCSTTASVSVSGTDTAGTITIDSGTGSCSAGTLATVTFAASYGASPRVIFTPKNANGATLQYYNGTTTTSTFTLDSGTTTAASTTYIYNYQVIQ